jgi:hypothetical protein
MAGMVLCLGLVGSITWFNRPKFLVPPQRRGEPGSFASRRMQRKGRNARGSAVRQSSEAGTGVTAGEGVVSLLPGEQVSARLMANHHVKGRSFEGYLYVTTERIIFVPWAAAEIRGGVPFGFLLAEVTGADVAPRRANWRDGSCRQRLQVTRSSGEVELFVVWRARKAANLIERVRQGCPEP